MPPRHPEVRGDEADSGEKTEKSSHRSERKPGGRDVMEDNHANDKMRT